MGIDDGNCVIELGCNVKQPISWADDRAVRPDTVPEIQVAGHLASSNINHDHVASVSPWLADPGVAVDRDIRESAIRRGGNLMSSCAVLGNRRALPARFGIDNAKRAVAFVGNQQHCLSRSVCSPGFRDSSHNRN